MNPVSLVPIFTTCISDVVNGNHLQCREYEFEHVKELSYLGSQLNQINSTIVKYKQELSAEKDVTIHVEHY